jgi:hypothetical protein
MAGAYRRTAKAENGVPPRLAGRVVEVLAESATQEDSFLCRLPSTNELHHIPRAWFARPNMVIQPATATGWKADTHPMWSDRGDVPLDRWSAPDVEPLSRAAWRTHLAAQRPRWRDCGGCVRSTRVVAGTDGKGSDGSETSPDAAPRGWHTAGGGGRGGNRSGAARALSLRAALAAAAGGWSIGWRRLSPAAPVVRVRPPAGCAGLSIGSRAACRTSPTGFGARAVGAASGGRRAR